MPIKKPCERCGFEFTVRAGKNKRWCDRSCAAKARWESQEYREKMSARMSDKSEAQKRVASERFKRLNKCQDFRDKSDAAKRGKPFAGTRGGNGHYTDHQIVLHAALGWPDNSLEYSIATGNPRWRHASVDLAQPGAMVAIEIDGRPHLFGKQKDRDRRKLEMLASLGWTVLRFWNSQIDNNLPRVVKTINDVVAARMVGEVVEVETYPISAT